jgi:hypothetical protein
VLWSESTKREQQEDERREKEMIEIHNEQYGTLCPEVQLFEKRMISTVNYVLTNTKTAASN